MTTPDRAIRDHLVWLLSGGHAHATFDRAVARLPVHLRGARPRALPYSPWMLVEHLRLAQRDILEFSRNPSYVEPRWPDDYWPAGPAPPSPAAWTRAVAAFRRDLHAMIALVRNPKTDLYARIPWGGGQTILREALLVTDHNAYHVGQLVVVRRLLGAWSD